MTVSIGRVDATCPQVARRLMQMQREVLPADEPRDLDGDLWWIATEGGRAVGFAGMRLLEGDRGLIAYLSRAGVLRCARGRGIQKRLIRVRLSHAKRSGAVVAITDTAGNPASANSLIAQGFQMYDPQRSWALPESLYWIRVL